MARILVAEDSPTQAIQIQMVLEDPGHNVVVVEDGRKAVEAIEESVPDLIVTDLHMPEMNGLQLTEYIRENHEGVPVILMTADGTEEVAVEALRMGAASYIPKRFIDRDLLPTVDDIVQMLDARQNNARINDVLVSSEATYCFTNDHQLASAIVAKLESDLRALRDVTETRILHVTMALKEAVSNAIDHGNLELNSDIRDDDPNAYLEMGLERAKEEPYRDRNVTLTTRTTPDDVRYIIRDEGAGFDPSNLPDPTDPENLLRAHGRGMILIRSFMDDVFHNDTGNEITLVKFRQPVESND